MNNLSEHQKRWLTAVVAIFSAIAIYALLGHVAIFLFTGFFSMVCYFEWLNIGLSLSEYRNRKLRFSMIVALLVLLAVLVYDSHRYIYSLAILSFVFINLYYAKEGTAQKEAFRDLCFQSFGLIYMIGFLTAFPQIHALPEGPWFCLLLLLCIWSSDTGAYYGGKTFGSTKLAPNLSPNKTIEGSLSGLALSVVFCVVFGYLLIDRFSIADFLLLGAFTSALAQTGDLLQSLFKRVNGVKDSGTIFPGHGGAFDRFDSLILAAPFFLIFVELFVI